MKKLLIILLFPLFSLSQTNENYGSFFYNNFICNNQMINLIKAPIIYK